MSIFCATSQRSNSVKLILWSNAINVDYITFHPHRSLNFTVNRLFLCPPNATEFFEKIMHPISTTLSKQHSAITNICFVQSKMVGEMRNRSASYIFAASVPSTLLNITRFVWRRNSLTFWQHYSIFIGLFLNFFSQLAYRRWLSIAFTLRSSALYVHIWFAKASSKGFLSCLRSSCFMISLYSFLG